MSWRLGVFPTDELAVVLFLVNKLDNSSFFFPFSD